MSREMKDSGIEWIGKIPEDWEVVKLGVVADISTGNTPKDPDNIKYSKSEGVDWLKTNNLLGVDGVSNSSLKIKEQYISEARLTNPRSVLITCIGDIGKLGYISKPVAFNQQINSITFTKDIVYWKYGMYALYSQREQQESFANGNVLKILNRENQKKVVITVPKDINKQIKISNALDKMCLYIRKLVDKTQLSIKELKKYKQSLITESVTKGIDPNVEMKDSGIEWVRDVPKNWEVKPIKYSVNERKEQLNSQMNPYDEINYVDISSVSYAKGVEKIESLKFKDAPSRARKIVYHNDIIISTVRTYLKSIDRINYNIPLIVSTGFCVLKPRNHISANFLEYAIKSDYFTNQVEQFSTGIAYPSITSRALLSLNFIEPPLNEQQEIFKYLNDKVDTIDRLIEDKTKVVEELENYKNSLIYEYVTGKKEV
ncbi:restriction endonuclease subunit S [Staphylococcus cohnii]|uniref:restriction endonuclease subunit S n=1 Tax=Staphylococcus cohnii TaxID=29382 RepID=UPI0018680328|nr:restriction endonuclease subunit S [Staphylococcus cohnii]